MARMTRAKDKYECRIAGGCPAEDWIVECIEGEIVNLPCDTCPFMKYINQLAEYEDMWDDAAEAVNEQMNEELREHFPNMYKLVYGQKESSDSGQN